MDRRRWQNEDGPRTSRVTLPPRSRRAGPFWRRVAGPAIEQSSARCNTDGDFPSPPSGARRALEPELGDERRARVSRRNVTGSFGSSRSTPGELRRDPSRCTGRSEGFPRALQQLKALKANARWNRSVMRSRGYDSRWWPEPSEAAGCTTGRDGAACLASSGGSSATSRTRGPTRARRPPNSGAPDPAPQPA